jgi:hypothetical protein
LRDEKPMHLAAAEAQPANCIGPSLRSDDKMHLRNFTSVLQKSPYPRMISTVNYKFAVRGVFMGPSGLRAGWRLLIFFAILVPLAIGGRPDYRPPPEQAASRHVHAFGGPRCHGWPWESTRHGRGAKSFSTAYLPAGFRARNIFLMPASTVPHGLRAARSGRKQAGSVSRC